MGAARLGVVGLLGGLIASACGSTVDRSGVGPTERWGAAVAWDPNSERLLLFGGEERSDARGDTWAYDGSAWVELNVEGPSPRRDAALAWDPSRGALVLFGGASWKAADQRYEYFDDTWLWNGFAWAPLPLLRRPPGLRGALMTWDPSAMGLLLYGGSRDLVDFQHVWQLSSTTATVGWVLR